MPENKGEAYEELWEKAYKGQMSWEDILLLQQQNQQAARADGSLQREASELSDLSFVLQELGRPKEAIAALLRELKLRRSLGDALEVVRTVQDLGMTLRKMGRFHSAIRCLRVAGAEFGRLGYAKPAFQDLAAVADLLSQVGSTEKARETFQLALPLAEEGNGCWNRAEILRALGLLHQACGDLSEALECEHLAAAESHRLEEEGDVAEGLYRIGKIYLAQGLQWEAQEAFRESMEIFRRLGRRKKANRVGEAIRKAQTNDSRRATVDPFSHKLLTRGCSRIRGV